MDIRTIEEKYSYSQTLNDYIKNEKQKTEQWEDRNLRPLYNQLTNLTEKETKRFQEELQKGISQLTGDIKVKDNKVKLLTSCPACQQGLSRYENDTGLETEYIVIELANRILGKDWEKDFIQKATAGGIERVLL